MGRVQTIKRALFNKDHFEHNESHFKLSIETVIKGLDVSFKNWPSMLPPWGKYIVWTKGWATIPKKVKISPNQQHKEWFAVAVDFDGIINPYPPEKPFPYMGIPDPNVVSVINRLFIEGYCIIIWTCRGGKLIKPLKEYLNNNGILFHYVNENPEYDLKYNDLSKKVAVNIYWDDRNVFHKNEPGTAYTLITNAFENAVSVDPGGVGAGIDPNLRR